MRDTGCSMKRDEDESGSDLDEVWSKNFLSLIISACDIRKLNSVNVKNNLNNSNAAVCITCTPILLKYLFHNYMRDSRNSGHFQVSQDKIIHN